MQAKIFEYRAVFFLYISDISATYRTQNNVLHLQ